MPSKYNISSNKEKRTFNGIVFDSEMEMKFYVECLMPLVEKKEVIYYELQKPYVLQDGFYRNNKKVKAIIYVADFFMRYKDGREIIIDIKGYADSIALLKRKMFWYRYPDVDYRWITYVKKYGGWHTYEYIKEQRTKAKKEKKLNEN